MPQWKKPSPPYAVAVPPQFADTPYDELPVNVQQALDVMRIDAEKVVPEPQPDVMHPQPELEPSPHVRLRDEAAHRDADRDVKPADAKAKK